MLIVLQRFSYSSDKTTTHSLSGSRNPDHSDVEEGLAEHFQRIYYCSDSAINAHNKNQEIGREMYGYS